MGNTARWIKLVILAACLYLPAAAQAELIRIDHTHASVTYQGEWMTVSAATVHGGSVAAANTAGASATITFNGTGITLIGYGCPCAGGKARIYLDGALAETVSSFAYAHDPLTPLYRVRGLFAGTHVLRIEVTGDTYAGDSAYFAVDAFDIEDGNAVPLIQEGDAAVSYTGNWTLIFNRNVSGESVYASPFAGASATVRFNGTGISWIGYRCGCAAGIAAVSVDGVPAGEVNTNSTGTEARAEIYRIEGLASGEHTLRIDVTGRTAGSSPWIVVDAFRVLGGAGGGSGDTTLPTARFTSPTESLVTGTVTLSVSAEDNVGVTKVRFFAAYGGAVHLLAEDNTAPYSITQDTSHIASGQGFVLSARAYDAAGNEGRAPEIFVRVQHTDRTFPSVAVSAPAAGSTVSGTINVSVAATDDFGIASVGLWRDGGCCLHPLRGTTSVPYTIALDTRSLLDGAHTLVADAVDTAGNSSESAPVAVTVDNRVQPGMVRIDEEHPSIVYGSGWTHAGDGSALATTFNWSDYTSAAALGSTATLSFDGIGVRWIGYGCDLCGDATVSIDGGPEQPIGLEGEEMGKPGNIARVVYSSPVLANGRHTLKITIVDLNAVNPTAGPVIIDGFEVLQ